MIVISGALVVVALVLLVLGVTGPELDLVYGSIAVSLLSLVFLVLGILQRRGEVLPAGATAAAERDVRNGEADSEVRVSDVQPQPADQALKAPLDTEHGSVPIEEGRSGDAGESFAPHSEDTDRAGSAPLSGADEDSSGTVLVVANRPRYHVPGCRHLAGKTPESRDVSDAVAQGFTPCGVCRPDAVLRGATPPEEALFPTEPALVPAARAARVAGPRATPVARPPAEQVVVNADRNRYHRADCRHVRGLPGTRTLEPAEAVRQGYSPCGVCKP